jgi:F-type H+-transporting ATPase subunit b
MNIGLTLVAQAIAFGIFIWFSAKFVWPPLMRAIEKRQAQVAEGLAISEKARVELQNAHQQSEAELKRARERAQELIASAEKRAAQIIDEAKVAAKEEGDRMIAAAKAELDQNVARARESLRDHVAHLAVAGAEKILQREVDAKVHGDMLAELKSALR